MLRDRRSVSKRKMVYIFIIDVSRSMSYHGKLESLKEALHDVTQMAMRLSANSSDYQIEFMALLYGTGDDGMDCMWIHPQPIPVGRFEWGPIHAKGWTPLAKALEMLEEFFHSRYLMDSPSGFAAPVVILLSDGRPCIKNGNERKRVDAVYDRLKKNKWFQISIKTAVAIGDDADMDELAKIAGSEDYVFGAHDVESMREIMRFILVETTMVRTNMIGKEELSTKNKVKKAELKNANVYAQSGWVDRRDH